MKDIDGAGDEVSILGSIDVSLKLLTEQEMQSGSNASLRSQRSQQWSAILSIVKTASE